MERFSVRFQGMRAGTLDYDERTHSFTFGLEAELKHQEEGGPTIGRCLRAIRGLRLGFAEQRKFLDYVIFNALIGNADAHGKNFSILYRGHRPEVAPLYDAMSTAIYEGATSRMAMYIGSAVSSCGEPFGQRRAVFRVSSHLQGDWELG